MINTWNDILIPTSSREPFIASGLKPIASSHPRDHILFLSIWKKAKHFQNGKELWATEIYSNSSFFIQIHFATKWQESYERRLWSLAPTTCYWKNLFENIFFLLNIERWRNRNYRHHPWNFYPISRWISYTFWNKLEGGLIFFQKFPLCP